MSNTIQHISFESVVPIMLGNLLCPEILSFSGTGFFVQFPPYEDIFFITAKHCILDKENKISGTITIPYVNGDNKAITFSKYLTTNYIDDELEDVIVYIVGDIGFENKKILKDKSLKLSHQEDIEFAINGIIKRNENIRTVGFPSVSKEINYSENTAKSQARGFYGETVSKSKIRNRYIIDKLNWKDGELNGFSGSPVLALYQDIKQPIVIGILLTGSSVKAGFISINVVTDLIAKYISENIS